MITDADRARAAARDIADAIGRRDIASLSAAMAPGFVHRTVGGETLDAGAFLKAIESIPGEIMSVELEHVTVDVSGESALVTGTQRARVRVNGEVVDDRGAFVDWFVKVEAGWRIRAAVSLPPPA